MHWMFPPTVTLRYRYLSFWATVFSLVLWVISPLILGNSNFSFSYFGIAVFCFYVRNFGALGRNRVDRNYWSNVGQRYSGFF